MHANWPSWLRLLVTGPASTFGEIQTRLNCFTLSFPVHCLSKFFFFCQKLLEWRLTGDSVTWKRHSVSDLAAQMKVDSRVFRTERHEKYILRAV